MCTEASQLVKRDSEKKLLLAALSQVPDIKSLSMTMPHIESPAVSNEASIAIVAISEKIAHKNPAPVISALQTVLPTIENNDLARKARRIINRAKSYKK